jgi:hypothetical protein
MPRSAWASWVLASCLLACNLTSAQGQIEAPGNPGRLTLVVILVVVDENGLIVPDAQVALSEPDEPTVLLHTDYAGRCKYSLAQSAPYNLVVDKAGFYQTQAHDMDPRSEAVKLILAHQQIVREQVDVVASRPGIDLEQTSDKSTMSTPEIVNIPYPTSRDIRNLLPFNPGVVQDGTGQIHVAGSATFATLDLLDGFDIRSPVGGTLSLRVSTDAVRSTEVEKTRYPVQYGKATGGVVSFFSGMGDKHFRFNATDFLPSYRENQGLHFDKFAPRVTFSGPLAQGRAWYFDGAEMEYDNVIIPGLPTYADSNHLWRESNLGKSQVNITPNDILIGGLLFNSFYSPYNGLSTLTPRASTTKNNTIAWFPYLRSQHSSPGGALLDLGIGLVHIRDGYEPHGDTPFEVTPEVEQGSYFENLTGRSRRLEETGVLYLPPRHWAGRHDIQAGVDLDEIRFGEEYARSPIRYLREDGSLLRLSTFPDQSPFARGNVEIGAYAQDRWFPRAGVVIEPGIRFDWDQIVRRPLYSPRLAATYSPGDEANTKLSAGIGLYYEHTQLQYLEQALAGLREDTYYAADGVTPVGPPLETEFVANNALLRAPRTLNWSVGIERKLPAAIYASVSYLEKHGTDAFVFTNQNAQNGQAALSGTYLLTNARENNYRSVETDLRHTFPGGYVLFASYTRSSARTNAALEYSPTLSVLGAQQPGPLPWDTPNRVISWGWLPVPWLSNWSFVYTANWQTGFPFTSVDANQVVVGQPGSRRFPDFLSISPGLEWRFHFRGYYFGLRGVLENATDQANPTVVNNVVVSPQYGIFTEPEGRALTARIRLISTKK